MKKYTIYLLLLLTYPSIGQSKHAPPPPPKDDGSASKVRWEKVHPYKYSDIQRKFPFSQSTSVVLVAFKPPPIMDPGIIDVHGNLVRQPEPPHEGTDTLGHKSVLEIVVLKEAQVQQVGALFYNLMCATNVRDIGSCYNPRNAIVFLDKDAHVVAELELCFECTGSETHPRDFYTGDMCVGRYNALQRFFVKAGIKYGATKKYRYQ